MMKRQSVRTILTNQPLIQEPDETHEVKNNETVNKQNGNTVERHYAIQPHLTNREEEKAIDRTTVSFTPAQTEKLARMAIDYKKRTGKKIVANEIIRRLVDKSTLEDILVSQL